MSINTHMRQLLPGVQPTPPREPSVIVTMMTERLRRALQTVSAGLTIGLADRSRLRFLGCITLESEVTKIGRQVLALLAA